MQRAIPSFRLALSTLALVCALIPAVAQFSSGSTGADGAFVVNSAPMARYRHAMAPFPPTGTVIAHGGTSDAATYMNDTWAFDGTRWSSVPGGSPMAGRYGHAMVYDVARQKIVMFGGYTGGYSSQTWEFDGATWTLKSTAAAPSARYLHAMVYDVARSRVVLFGGSGSQTSYASDTWEYDGANWTQVATPTSPVGRHGHAMAYDELRSKTILFSGIFYSTDLDDTWEYNGTNWSRIFPGNSPARRYSHAMAFCPSRGKVVLFGGAYNSTFVNDGGFWEFDGSTWALATGSMLPMRREYHTMCGLPGTTDMILFGGNIGGSTWRSDTWRLGAAGWSSVVSAGGEGLVFNTASRPSGIWNFTTIDIAGGTDMTFAGGPLGLPVTWLATGDVRVAGTLELSGGTSSSNLPGNEAPPGQGGYPGGLGGTRFDQSGSYAGTGGQGPGGGTPGTTISQAAGGAGHATAGSGALGGAAYGNILAHPLVGGSGGGGGASSNSSNGGSGGGGGGAILIASSSRIEVNGQILAKGGNATGNGGGGSGGAIRLVAPTVAGTGVLNAVGGSGGGAAGRIRVEASAFDSATLRNNSTPAMVTAPVKNLYPFPQGSIRIVRVAGQDVPQPPSGSTLLPDITFSQAGPVTVEIETTGIPAGTVIAIRATVAGVPATANSTPVGVNGAATATITVPVGVGTVQGFATYNAP